MTEKPEGHQSNRRSFLRNATAIGLGAAGATLASPLTSISALANEHKDNHDHDKKPEFVRKEGRNFTIDDKTFYFGGTNNYYLHYDSHFMIDDVLNNAVAMGLSVMRLWGFLDGAGANGFVMQPTPGVFPEAGYERFDYTVWKAGQLGLRLVVPLVNNWNDFGGMQQYVTWFGAATHDDFYTNSQIMKAYQNYVRNFIRRTNRYTGLRMMHDSTIMTWELANEPRCQSDTSGNNIVNWAHEMSAFIKDVDNRHLVCVGDEGFFNNPGSTDFMYNGGGGVDWKRLVALPHIDYGTMHLYPDGWGKTEPWALQWITDHIQAAKVANKPVVLEEFGWRDLTTRDAIYAAWLDLMLKGGGNGTQFWILTGLQDDGTLYPNFDGFRVNNPSSTASVISAHAAQMRAKSGKRI